MSSGPESLVLQLRAMRAEMGEMRLDLKADIQTLRADVASDLIEVSREVVGVRKDLSEQIVGLRRAMVEYHTSVIGHGVIISELEARVRRLEQRLDTAPLEAN